MIKSTKNITKINFNNHAFSSETEASTFEKKAQNLIHTLTKSFIIEAKESLSNMHQTLEDISFLNDNEKTRVIQNSFFQAAHDLKGQGDTYGYPLITKLAAHLCDQIKKQKNYSQKNIHSFKLDILDMQDVIQEAPNHANSKLTNRILKRLECDNE